MRWGKKRKEKVAPAGLEPTWYQQGRLQDFMVGGAKGLHYIYDVYYMQVGWLQWAVSVCIYIP